MISNLSPLAILVLATLSAAQTNQGPIQYDAAHNATSIVGTWSTGNKDVRTGPDFANPSNVSFTYPANTGESYSFSDDGWYEISRFRMNSNASEPNCITAVMYWTHGTYELLPNGSIATYPNGDGYQQIQDPCAPISNFFENANYTELFTQWRIFLDPTFGPKLHMWKFDGNPVAPMFQLSTTPTMLPTTKLRNTTAASAGTGSTRKRSLLKRSNAGVEEAVVGRWTFLSVGASVVFAFVSSVL
ncbi:rot1 protein [Moniliophthora roreri MCA 2997]|uniref:Protein ROT1 n=1 Tax=Moniliophthora roreri (strain MCA 2997) TaxID=1381753 RepID=V2WW95_MONRO|nr:rot1 protein [Moniliophthora roreri MCA 2997]